MANKKQANPGAIPRGSDGHAAFLGLVKAKKDDEPQLKGWTLADVTMWGPSATAEFLKRVLAQKVSELTTPMPEVQSDDPLAPNYAPPMWMPSGEPVTGMV